MTEDDRKWIELRERMRVLAARKRESGNVLFGLAVLGGAAVFLGMLVAGSMKSVALLLCVIATGAPCVYYAAITSAKRGSEEDTLNELLGLGRSVEADTRASVIRKNRLSKRDNLWLGSGE